MENQIKVGSVVALKVQGGRYTPINFVVFKMDGPSSCFLTHYSPVTGMFEKLPGSIPVDSLVLVEARNL